jgi:trehalose/maltose hydrolase-like predicted phosphorylase
LEARLYATKASDLAVALAFRACLAEEAQGRLYWQAEGRAGTTLRLRRSICVYTSRDGAAPAQMAIAHLGEKRWDDFDRELAAHEARWAEYWRTADVQTAGSAATTQALRFNAYHLRIAADHDPKVSVGARTLSGRAYEGHVFWDVEVFMLPFYLHVSPDIARCYCTATIPWTEPASMRRSWATVVRVMLGSRPSPAPTRRRAASSSRRLAERSPSTPVSSRST